MVIAISLAWDVNMSMEALAQGIDDLSKKYEEPQKELNDLKQSQQTTPTSTLQDSEVLSREKRMKKFSSLRIDGKQMVKDFLEEL